MTKRSSKRIVGFAGAAVPEAAKPAELSLGEQIARHAQLSDVGRKAYAQARELEETIVKQLRELPDGVETVLPDGRVAKLVDNFAEKNTVWKPAGVQRFSIELSEPK